MGECDAQRFSALKTAEQELLQFKADFARAVLGNRPCNPEALAMAANALTALGYYADGLEFDRRLYALRPRDPVVVYNLSCSLALVNDRDAAFAMLEEAIDLGYSDAAQMRQDPDWEKVRELPRFQELLARAEDKHKAQG